jgi:hypothetical protein
VKIPANRWGGEIAATAGPFACCPAIWAVSAGRIDWWRAARSAGWGRALLMVNRTLGGKMKMTTHFPARRNCLLVLLLAMKGEDNA